MADPRALVAALRRYPDPAASTDPMISALVRRLSTLPSPVLPDPGFRAELRAQLVAVTPRLVAEGVPPDAVTTAVRPRRSAGPVRAAWHRLPFRRPLAVVGTLVVIFGLLLTGAVWLSSSTLPGDSLYGLKRASENVELSLTGGDGARGKEYLTLSRRRVDEVSKLLARSSALAAGGGISASDAINAHTAKLVTSTLGDADSDLRNASRLLTGQAVHDSSPDSLRTLLGWTPQQISRLMAITDRIPPGALHDRATASEQLATRARDRANQLLGSLDCACLSGTSTDDLGPLPCHLPCTRPPAGSTAPSSPAPGTAVTSPGSVSAPPSTGRPTASGGVPASRPAAPGSTGSAPGGGGAPGGGSSSAPGPSSSGGPTGPGLPTGALPTGVLPTGALPTSGSVGLDPCGAAVTIGPIGIGLGLCGSHPHR